MCARVWLSSACFVLLLTPLSGADLREWTSDNGEFTVEAELIAFDGEVAQLRKPDGDILNVPMRRLSVPDREFLRKLHGDDALAPARNAKKVPLSVTKFQASMEAMRPLETKRLEDRLAALRLELRSGGRKTAHGAGLDAKLLARELVKRLSVVKSGEPFVPRISPKDFRVGQIGELDDELQFTISAEPEDDSLHISISFHEISYRTGLPGVKNVWHHSTISRPDLIILRADFVDRLPKTRRDRDPKSPANQLLRSHVYEVTDVKQRGAARDFVLAPFKMDEVNQWLDGEK